MKAQALGRYDLMRELEVGMDALEMKRDEMHAIQGLA